MQKTSIHQNKTNVNVNQTIITITTTMTQLHQLLLAGMLQVHMMTMIFIGGVDAFELQSQSPSLLLTTNTNSKSSSTVANGCTTTTTAGPVGVHALCGGTTTRGRITPATTSFFVSSYSRSLQVSSSSSLPPRTSTFRLFAGSSSASSSSASTLRSVTFSNIRKDQEPQLLCNLLMELGACSTSIVDAEKGTNKEEAIFHEFTNDEQWPTTNSNNDGSFTTRTAVTTHVWNTCHVSAQFPASTSLEWIMEIIQDTFPEFQLPSTYSRVENVDDTKDWVLHVQQSWKPIVLPPFVLRFPWHSDQTVEEAIQQQQQQAQEQVEDLVQLELQGGIAFGTGEHPTTKLCLDFVSKNVKPNMMIMDYGSGSGVLGMAACKLESTVTAVGVDIDVDAVQIGNQNAQTNNVKMKNYLSNLVQTQGDDESTSLLLKAYSSNSKLQQHEYGVEILPDDLSGPVFDACVANILAGPLIMLGPTIAGLLKQGSPLGLSGIMSSQSEMILNDPVYQNCFDRLRVEKELDGWVLITGIRNYKPIQ